MKEDNFTAVCPVCSGPMAIGNKVCCYACAIKRTETIGGQQ